MPASPPVSGSPVVSDLPVLLLSGELDPISPPEYAERAAQHLSNATSVELKGRSHGNYLAGDCVLSIIEEFLKQYEEAPDISCIHEMTGQLW